MKIITYEVKIALYDSDIVESIEHELNGFCSNNIGTYSINRKEYREVSVPDPDRKDVYNRDDWNERADDEVNLP